jgi:hypothetical protein
MSSQQCKLEVIRDIYGNKTVTYPDSTKNEFINLQECKSFEDCFQKMAGARYRTKYAIGAHTDTHIKDFYAKCTTKTSLIIPKDTVVIKNQDGSLIAEKAYTYNHEKSCKWGDCEITCNSNFRYQNDGKRIFETGKRVESEYYIPFR